MSFIILNLYIKKLLILIMLGSLVFESSGLEGNNKPIEESCLLRSLKRMGREIKSLFDCCSSQSTEHQYQRILDVEYLEEEINEIRGKSSILILPTELLFYLFNFLDPHSIVNCIKSTKRFSCLRSKDFWNQYNISKKI